VFQGIDGQHLSFN
jgi:hypothetical protein